VSRSVEGRDKLSGDEVAALARALEAARPRLPKHTPPQWIRGLDRALEGGAHAAADYWGGLPAQFKEVLTWLTTEAADGCTIHRPAPPTPPTAGGRRKAKGEASGPTHLRIACHGLSGVPGSG
jgi:hypothetical protein